MREFSVKFSDPLQIFRDLQYKTLKRRQTEQKNLLSHPVLNSSGLELLQILPQLLLDGKIRTLGGWLIAHLDDLCIYHWLFVLTISS